MDDRAFGTAEQGPSVFETTDCRHVSRGLNEVTGCFDLWTHRPGWELKSAELVDGGATNRSSRGRRIIDLDGTDVGEKEERIGTDELREQRSRAVLIDHGLDPAQSATLISDDGNAATPAANHTHIAFE